jgi:hypothetical protein
MTVLCVTPEPQTHSHTSSPLHSLVHRPTTVLSCCFVWRMIHTPPHQEGEGTVPVTTAEQSPCCSKLNSRHDAAKSSHHDRSTAPQRWWVCPKVGVCWSWSNRQREGCCQIPHQGVYSSHVDFEWLGPIITKRVQPARRRIGSTRTQP